MADVTSQVKHGLAINIAWEGLVETRNRLLALAQASNATRDLGTALYRRGNVVLRVAVFLCPRDTGTLARSGYVRVPAIFSSYTADDTVVVEVVFGGVAAPYAWYVHENLFAHHPNGQAKYLETAVQAERAGTIEELVEGVRNYLTNTGRYARAL